MEMSSSKMHALMRLNALMDGNLVYAKEHLLSDLPAKNGYNYLTYNGESHKLVDDKDKSIT